MCVFILCLQFYGQIEILYDMLGRSQSSIILIHTVFRYCRLLIELAEHRLVLLYLQIRANIYAKILETAAPVRLPPLVFPLIHGSG